jgi:hypothetical protein
VGDEELAEHVIVAVGLPLEPVLAQSEHLREVDACTSLSRVLASTLPSRYGFFQTSRRSRSS